VLSGLVDQLEQDLPLAGEAHTLFAQGTFDGVDGHKRLVTF
jgi:hypothetical protein